MSFLKNRRSKATIALLPVLLLVACTNWERTTYQTLATSKAVIDSAAQQYNSGAIPQTKTNHDIIQKAQHSQDIAVDAFKVYLFAKAGSQGDIATLQANVTAAVTQLTLDILNVKNISQGVK